MEQESFRGHEAGGAGSVRGYVHVWPLDKHVSILWVTLSLIHTHRAASGTACQGEWKRPVSELVVDTITGHSRTEGRSYIHAQRTSDSCEGAAVTERGRVGVPEWLPPCQWGDTAAAPRGDPRTEVAFQLRPGRPRGRTAGRGCLHFGARWCQGQSLSATAHSDHGK